MNVQASVAGNHPPGRPDPGAAAGAVTVLHPELGEVRAAVTRVGDHPDGQVAETIELMARYVGEDVGEAGVVAAAHQAAAPGSPPVAIIAGVWDWVRERVRFREDEATARPLGAQGIGTKAEPVVEVLIRPRDIVKVIRERGSVSGDCDDFAMLAAALLGVHGIPTDFVTVAAVPGSESWSHVYVAAEVGGARRLPLDLSHGPWPGWEHGDDRRKTYWPAYRPLDPALVIVALALIWWIGTGGMGMGDGDGY